tara:strand:- start:353 stop:529 length:177 start_codon:yes stop_codon:yes gene_type:complete
MEIHTSLDNKTTSGIKTMDSELIKWLSQMPKNYELSGSKKSFYNGEKQLKLFLKIKSS